MTLPNGKLAYRALNSANLTTDQMTLCQATMTDLKYSEMVKQLRRLFADPITFGHVNNPSTIQPKEEPVFYQEHKDKISSVHYSGSRGGRGWYRGNGNRKENYRPRKRGGNDQKGIMNPEDAEGNLTRCQMCESKHHWVENCPVQAEQSKTPAKTDISLFQSQNTEGDEVTWFVGETLNCAVLDSGCSHTVCGQNWLKCFEDSLDEGVSIKKRSSCATFKFGNGRPVQSLKKVALPVTIENDKISQETDVVDTDIPLLLSKTTMKKPSTVTDFNKDTTMMFGKQQPLVKTTSGHYAIPLRKRQQIVETCPTEEVQSILICTNNSPTKKEIIRLHRQFGHCSEQKLLKLIKSAAIWEDSDETKKLVTELSEECVICKWYKKRKLRPIVSIPLVSEFNHTVAMVLITYEQGT